MIKFLIYMCVCVCVCVCVVFIDLGFVFQTFNLLATMSAYENVELPMIILGKLSKKERHERTVQLLKSIFFFDHYQ
jgi:ABC-type lipoprotein export system ATPase subunit